MGGGTRAVFAAALLWAAAADNATHTIVATVLNAKYVPLFELWHPRFAAATDATVELVVACLDDEAVAAVRLAVGRQLVESARQACRGHAVGGEFLELAV